MDSFEEMIETIRRDAINPDIRDEAIKFMAVLATIAVIKKWKDKEISNAELFVMSVLTVMLESKAVDWGIFRYQLAHFLENYQENIDAMAI